MTTSGEVCLRPLALNQDLALQQDVPRVETLVAAGGTATRNSSVENYSIADIRRELYQLLQNSSIVDIEKCLQKRKDAENYQKPALDGVNDQL